MLRLYRAARAMLADAHESGALEDALALAALLFFMALLFAPPV